MKKFVLLFALLLACVCESFAQKTVFKFRDAQARAGNAETEVVVKPTVVDVQIQKVNNQYKKIQDTWPLSKEEVEIGMDGKLDNIRAWGTYLSVQKHQCDVIMGATYKVEDDEETKGYKVTVVGYPGNFANWHPATKEDFDWIQIQRASGANEESKKAPIVKSRN